MTVTIYHNARCSKSRTACQLVAERGVPAEIVNYLDTPPDRETLRALLAKLGLPAADLVRRGEAVFKEHYAGRTLSEDEWLDALVARMRQDEAEARALLSGVRPLSALDAAIAFAG